MFKIDVFVMEVTAFARQNRARCVALDIPDLGRVWHFTSPEFTLRTNGFALAVKGHQRHTISALL
jgi:hypothetical protein